MGEQDIAAVVQRSTEALTLADQALRIGDQAGAEEALANIAQEMLKSIPLVGPAFSEAFKRAFANSAYMRMQQELAALAAEQDKNEYLSRLVLSVEELLAQTLIQVAGIHHQTHSENLKALGGLRQDLADFRAAVESNFQDYLRSHPSAGYDHRVEQGRIANGALGVRVSSSTQKRLYIRQQEITGSGSVGVSFE